MQRQMTIEFLLSSERGPNRSPFSGTFLEETENLRARRRRRGSIHRDGGDGEVAARRRGKEVELRLGFLTNKDFIETMERERRVNWGRSGIATFAHGILEF
ncbi:hypothetical protein NL676_034584 [Syzygium grande]|nr:hypothetical protein NL676_034584 [Syzygium grande]